MDANEIRRRVDAIIERQDEAMLKLDASRHAFDTAITVIRDKALAGIGIGLDALRGANDAQAEVIASLRAGNREALQILRNLPQ